MVSFCLFAGECMRAMPTSPSCTSSTPGVRFTSCFFQGNLSDSYRRHRSFDPLFLLPQVAVVLLEGNLSHRPKGGHKATARVVHTTFCLQTDVHSHRLPTELGVPPVWQPKPRFSH